MLPRRTCQLFWFAFALTVALLAVQMPASAHAQATPQAVEYSPGWHQVSLPPGTQFTDAPLDGLVAYSYDPTSGYQLVPDITAYSGPAWVYFPQTVHVVLGAGSDAPVTYSQLSQWVLVGNPSGHVPARSSGSVLRWNPDTQRYETLTELPAGSGGWVFVVTQPVTVTPEIPNTAGPTPSGSQIEAEVRQKIAKFEQSIATTGYGELDLSGAEILQAATKLNLKDAHDLQEKTNSVSADNPNGTSNIVIPLSYDTLARANAVTIGVNMAVNGFVYAIDINGANIITIVSPVASINSSEGVVVNLNQQTPGFLTQIPHYQIFNGITGDSLFKAMNPPGGVFESTIEIPNSSIINQSIALSSVGHEQFQPYDGNQVLATIPGSGKVPFQPFTPSVGAFSPVHARDSYSIVGIVRGSADFQTRTYLRIPGFVTENGKFAIINVGN